MLADLEAEPVLYAHHRRDRQRLGQVRGCHVRKAQVPDQPRVAQAGERAEALGDES